MTRVEPVGPAPTEKLAPIPDVAVFDTETTGIDVETARFVQVYAGAIVGGLAHHGRTWLINPGIPIPPGASEVHGIYDDDLDDAPPASVGVALIVSHLEDLVDAAIPIVIYNAPYDLTVLHRETLRHHGPDAAADLARCLDEAIVLDPLVIDKAIDRYRPGSRKLADVAEHYGLEFDRDSLHGADADARLAGRLMLHLWSTHPKLIGLPASHLHERCVALYREQAASFADYLHSRGQHDAALEVDDRWPWRPTTDHDYHHRSTR